ncbi:MAG: hypothetical protein KAX77_00905 [Xanthomonadales bacterium]|nr:hypothetical protein [Xanthomonadales bacterium]
MITAALVALRAAWAMLAGTLGPLIKLVPWWAWGLAAILAWGGWQRHVATKATKAAAQAEQRATVEALAAEAERKERQIEQAYTVNARTAADAYAQNLRAARVAADRARDSHDRLRDAIAATAAPGCTGASSAAAGGTDGAAQLRQVLGSCAAALRDVAAAADQDAAQLVGLQGHMRALGIAPAASAPTD